MAQNGRIFFAIFAGAFGSAWQHGYNTGVLNAPQSLIEDFIRGGPPGCDNKTEASNATVICKDEVTVTMIWSWVVAIFCIGGIIGGSMVGFVSKRFGRKGGLLANNILVVVATCLHAFSKSANSYEMLIAGRFVIGINSGLNAGLAPMYLSEIAPVALRGAVGTVYQLIITISILLSQVLGSGSILGNHSGWPFLLALTAIPAIIQVITLPFCPESPKYLLLDRDDEGRANAALQWLRGTVEVHSEMDEMKQEQESESKAPPVTLMGMIKNSSLRRPLIISSMMMLAQQLSGINAAIYFSTKIFTIAKLDLEASKMATIGMGCMNVFMTLVSMVMIEKAGRKTLMIIGLGGTCVTTVLLMISLLTVASVPFMKYLAIASVVLFICGFATGPGSIPWFFVTELFTQSGRPIATSVAVSVNWSANFLVGLLFSPLQMALGPYVFIIFIVIQIFFILYVWKVVPETKNRTIEEVTAQFRKN